MRRREFLKTAGHAVLAGAATCSMPGAARAARTPATSLYAGEATVDLTPPVGTPLGGVYREPDQPRLSTGARHPAAARALVLRHQDTLAAILSIDMLAVSESMARRVQQRVAQAAGIPPEHVRLCATHSHTMPTLRELRLHGVVPQRYQAEVETKLVLCVQQAKDGLAPAELSVGRASAPGASFNRTFETWKTDADFDSNSTANDRWLDTAVTVLQLARSGRSDLLWYHFSAHPVCYRDDTLTSPDWPYLVAQRVEQQRKSTPVFLQGHCGDVNPGDGKVFLGVADDVADIVARAVDAAAGKAQPVAVDRLAVATASCRLSYDHQRYQTWLEQVKADPDQPGRGWIAPALAKDWYRVAKQRTSLDKELATPISCLTLGGAALLFHTAELYSYFGLAIRRDSPFEHTIVVGYTDDLIGYVTDARAYERAEYGAVVVPKILDLPPFTPDAAERLTAEAVRLLRKAAG